jgi:hypothetical protein
MHLRFLLWEWIRNGETYRNHVLVGPLPHPMPRPSVSSQISFVSQTSAAHVWGNGPSAYHLAVLTYSPTCPRS